MAQRASGSCLVVNFSRDDQSDPVPVCRFFFRTAVMTKLCFFLLVCPECDNEKGLLHPYMSRGNGRFHDPRYSTGERVVELVCCPGVPRTCLILIEVVVVAA